VGSNRASGAAFAGYLLFERASTRELIEPDCRHTLAQRHVFF
jgi:NTE family protein